MPHVCIYLNFGFRVQCILAHMLLGDANKKKKKKKSIQRKMERHSYL